MPIITIQQNERTTAEKAEVTKRITEVLVDVYGTKAASVMVFFQEFDNQSWGKDGLLNCDRQKK
jgi:4-oxalocrotonate tautomerase